LCLLLFIVLEKALIIAAQKGCGVNLFGPIPRIIE
jgi:hypothetical protein